MEERLKNFKKSMDKTVFAKLTFSEQHQKQIREKISKEDHSEEDILLSVMQLLIHEKTGYELAKFLRWRGIQKFEDNEGFLYTLLHRLEQKGCLQSRWVESEAKYYLLNDKGRKILRKAEKKQIKKRFVLKEWLEG
jgi:DNA-binding PadR family transcriptional regulator